MSADIFLDTNILIYALGNDDPKRERAQELLNAGGTISVQVLNEFVSVSRRKFKRTWSEIREALTLLNTLLPDVTPLTCEIHAHALELSERAGFDFYDSLIVASALGSESMTLYTEDLQHGQKIEGLTIRNPFAFP